MKLCDMRRHVGAVHGVADIKTYQCDVCSRTFVNKLQLGRHVSAAHGIGDVEAFKCDVCSKSFARKDTLQRHLIKHVKVRAPYTPRQDHPGSKYPCDVCGRKFSQQRYMRMHRRTVHSVGGVKMPRCDICLSSFTREDYLARHLRTVHGIGDDIKTFPCDHCSYVAKEAGNLKKHMRRVHLHQASAEHETRSSSPSVGST